MKPRMRWIASSCRWLCIDRAAIGFGMSQMDAYAAWAAAKLRLAVPWRPRHVLVTIDRGQA